MQNVLGLKITTQAFCVPCHYMEYFLLGKLFWSFHIRDWKSPADR